MTKEEILKMLNDVKEDVPENKEAIEEAIKNIENSPDICKRVESEEEV